MTNNPTYDRNYLRMLEPEELVDVAKQRQTTELELVLIERLHDALRELEGDYYDRLADRNH